MQIDRIDQLAKALSENKMRWEDSDVQEAVRKLRGDRNFLALADVTEKCARYSPDNGELRRLQAQALIDSGQPATAISVIERVRSRLKGDDPEVPELQGLLGRAYKQMLVESGDGPADSKQRLLRQAMAAYSSAYRGHAERYWHGVNLLALACMAHRTELATIEPEHLQTLAQRVIKAARKDAEGKSDPWAYATIAEASIALNDTAATESALREFLNAPGLKAFHVGSFLRQLVQVWQLDGDEWAGTLAALSARHAEMPGADTTLLKAIDVMRMSTSGEAMQLKFERILGPASGLVTFEWWQLANRRALGVAAVRNDLNRTIGTAFLVDGSSLHQDWAGRTLALTNFHVVNREGIAKGLRPDTTSLVFEAVDAHRRHAIRQILWESPPHAFDCAILELDPAPSPTGAVPIAARLPLRNAQPPSRVIIIGHPAGRGLEFSINDNELLDHDEGQTAVTRLHYRAPTEGGSSGSPVFKEGTLEGIAIHHAYTEARLNGKPGSYQANEGIGLKSLRAALVATATGLANPKTP